MAAAAVLITVSASNVNAPRLDDPPELPDDAAANIVTNGAFSIGSAITLRVLGNVVGSTIGALGRAASNGKTLVQAKGLVRTIEKEAAKGGNRPVPAGSIRASSKTIARAGKIFTRKGATPLKGRVSGKATGLKSANGSRVYREPQVKKTGPSSGKKVANFVTKRPKEANVHVVQH